MRGEIRHIGDRNTVVLAVRAGSPYPTLCGESITREPSDFPLNPTLPTCESCLLAAGDSPVSNELSRDDFEWKTGNPSQGLYTYEFLGSVAKWDFSEEDGAS